MKTFIESMSNSFFKQLIFKIRHCISFYHITMKICNNISKFKSIFVHNTIHFHLEKIINIFKKSLMPKYGNVASCPPFWSLEASWACALGTATTVRSGVAIILSTIFGKNTRNDFNNLL